MVLVAKVHHCFGLKCNSIIGDDIFRTTKSGEDVGFKEFDDDQVSSIPLRDGFYPFGEIVSGSDDPLVLGIGGKVDFSNEI